jgi:hypothetical protein
VFETYLAGKKEGLKLEKSEAGFQFVVVENSEEVGVSMHLSYK